MPMNRSIARSAGFAAAAFVACVMLSTVRAEEYSWEVSGSHLDGDAGGAEQINHSALHATWYLSAVDDAAGPYELAPFLNRSSHVTVIAGRTKLREPVHYSLFMTDPLPPREEPAGIPLDGMLPTVGALPTESGVDTSEYVVAGRYVWPDTGWYAGAQAQRSSGDMLPGLPFARDMDSIALRLLGRF